MKVKKEAAVVSVYPYPSMMGQHRAIFIKSRISL